MASSQHMDIGMTCIRIIVVLEILILQTVFSHVVLFDSCVFLQDITMESIRYELKGTSWLLNNSGN